MKMKSNWTVLNVLLFFSFTSFNSASRTASSLLAAASASSVSSSNGNSSYPEYSSSSSSCSSSSSSSSSDSENVSKYYRTEYDPHFYFLVKPKFLDKLKNIFEDLPQNFHIVVRHKMVSKSGNRKRIIKFQKRCDRNVAILLSSSRAYGLNFAEDPAEMSKLLKGVRKYFSEVIFPDYIEPSPELSLYLEDQEITNIKISEYKNFSFKKWKAGMKSSEFEGNILFKWNYSSTRKFKRIMRFLSNMKVKKKRSPLKAAAKVEKPKGSVLNDFLRPGTWTLIFSKIEHKDLVRAFFNNHAAYLINLNETNSDTDDRLILKLEISDFVDLSTSNNIMDIVNGYKIRFEQNTLQKLEYVLLTWDQSDVIKRAFLDCGVHVIHPNFSIEHGLNFDFRNFEGCGIVDLSFDAGALIRTIDEHLDRQNLMSNFISMNDIVASKFQPPISSSSTEAQRRNLFYGMYARRESLRVSVERTNLFQSSIRTARLNNWRNFIGKNFFVKFLGEEGIDGGGLTREWFTEIFKIIFDPSFGLFKVSESNQNVFYPNELASEIFLNYLEYFKFAGLMVGVATTYPFPIGFQFAEFFLKILLGKPMKLHDLKDVDEGLYNFHCWLLDNSVSQLEDTFYFVYEFDYYGEHRSVDLKEGGSNIPLTDQNKFEYIFLVLRYVLVTKIRPHIDAFLSGFNLNISINNIRGFNVGELGGLISGKKDIDINDWERNTTYGQGFDRRSVQIVWFWQFMRTLDQPLLRKLLQFSTGSTTVPIEGFAALKGQNGVLKRFEISPSSDKNRLPGFKTCYNMIIMPKYDSYQDLVYKFMMALNEGAGIFTIG